MQKWAVATALALVAAIVLAGTGIAGGLSLSPEQLGERANATGQAKFPKVVNGARVSPKEARELGAAMLREAKAGKGSLEVEAGTGSELQTFSVTAAGESASTLSVAEVCWTFPALGTNHGIWPQEKTVYERRVYCAAGLGGLQTYRSSLVYGKTVICSWGNPIQWKVSGGNGWRFTKVHSQASFSCPSGFWWEYQFELWQEWSCNTWGTCAREATNGAT